jgi:hypothetical protein
MGNDPDLEAAMIIEPIWRRCARHVVVGVGIVALFALPTHGAGAQERLGSVAGLVTVMGSDRPVSGATAMLSESPHGATTDSTGRYRILGVPPGDYVLTIRRIGFESVSARIQVGLGTDVSADVDLSPSAPVQLEEVHVVADARLRGQLAGMEHRRSIQAGGTFISGVELDSAVAAGRSLPFVLARKLPGAQVTMYGRTGGALLSSGRGRTSGRQLPPADPADPKSPRGCWAQVYLDGMRIYSTKYGGMTVPDLRDIPLESLAAVEYYAGDAQTPSEFAGEGAACGTIAFWTK